MTIALIYSHQRQKLFFEFMVYCVSHTAWFVGRTIWRVSQTPQDAHGNSRGLEGTSGGVLYMKKSFLDKEKKVIIGTCWPRFFEPSLEFINIINSLIQSREGLKKVIFITFGSPPKKW